MTSIIPIKDLKNATAVSQLCHESNEPVFITKNGYGDMVIMSMEVYEQPVSGNDTCERSGFNETRTKENTCRTQDRVRSVLDSLKNENGSIPSLSIQETVIRLRQQGLTVDEIATCTYFSVADIERILEENEAE